MDVLTTQGVTEIMKNEARDTAELLLQKAASHVKDKTGEMPALAIREGETITELKKLIEEEKNINVLVFCDTTIQKSPTIILCYLIRYGMLNKENSIEMLKTKCPDIFKPYIVYEKTIDKFINELFDK